MSSLPRCYELSRVFLEVLTLLRHHLDYVRFYMQYTEAADLRSFIQLNDIELTWTHCEMLNFIQQVLKYFRKHGCPYTKLNQHLKEAETAPKTASWRSYLLIRQK